MDEEDELEWDAPADVVDDDELFCDMNFEVMGADGVEVHDPYVCSIDRCPMCREQLNPPQFVST